MAEAVGDQRSANISIPPADTASTCGVGFMDLSPEIRNEIYSLALIYPEPLLLSSHPVTRLLSVDERRKKKTGDKKYLRLKCDTRITVKGKQKRLVPVREAFGVSLLTANKTINAEAYPLFLSQNHFVFDRPSVLHTFCTNLGEQAKSLMHVTIKGSVSGNVGREQICILSRVNRPKTICVVAQPGDGAFSFCLSPSRTWEVIRPIVWRLEAPIKPGMSFRPSASAEAQLERLQAFKFDVSRLTTVLVNDREAQTIDSVTQREEKFKELVVECWRREANGTGGGRASELAGFLAGLRAGKKGRAFRE